MVSPAWLEQATCGLGMRPALQHNELHSNDGAAYSPVYNEIGKDLARLVDAWPKLAEPLKTAIMAIVDASEAGKSQQAL
jgi:hypothetical protein